MQSWLHNLQLRLRALFHRHQLDRDLDDELAFHLALREQKNQAAGVAADEARYAAHRQFGNYTQLKERSRDMWTFARIEGIFRDVRLAARTLRKNPGFTLVAVLTLALGIGANAAIFSVVDAMLLRPLPYPEPQRLVRIWEAQDKDDRNVVNPNNFMDWRDISHSFEAMSVLDWRPMNISIDGRPVALEGLGVSPEFFSILRVPPLLGRTFVAEDGTAGHDTIIVLSYALWQRQFGADPNVIGKQIRVDDVPLTVVGVMPQAFSFPKMKTEAWFPVVLEHNSGRYLTVVARLKRGVTIQQAQQDIAEVARYTAKARPADNQGWSANVVPMLDDTTDGVSRPLWVLLAAVGFLLLIACANLASLLLMRGTARLREIAVRSALGAGRSRIMQQLLIESMFLSFAGMAVGLFLASVGLRGLLALIPQNAPLPRNEPITIDARVFLFAFCATLFTAMVFGLIPALRFSRVDPQKALSQGTLRSGVGGQLLLRRLFVIAEVALALVLSVAAGLMLRSFARLIVVNPGFAPEHLVTMRVWTSPARYHDPLKRSQYYQEIFASLRNSPGVQAAGSIHFLPLTGSTSGSCFDSVDQPPPTTSSPEANFLIVSPGYFRTMNTAVIAGREFEARDHFDGPPAAVVNEAFVRKFSPNQQILGRQYNVCWSLKKPVEIVGVVADARQLGLDDAPEPTIFLSNTQAPMYFASIVVRAPGDPRQIMGTAEAAIHRVDPDQAISDMRTMDSVFSDSVSSPRFQMILLLVFAALALALSMIGVYGVVANSVTLRTQEIGIRVALGARVSQLAVMVLGEALTLAGIAVVLGLTGAFALTRLLQTLLFEISPTDPLTLSAVSAVVLLVAIVAALLPAHRATRVDPMVALRYE